LKNLFHTHSTASFYRDIKSLGVGENLISHKGIGFQFLDIKQFISFGFCMLTEGQQQKLMESIQSIVSDHNRPTKTKKYWTEHFNKG
jgi:hypothetical protein